LLNGNDGFVVPKTVKFAPGVFVKVNRNEPDGSFSALARMIKGDAGTLSIRKMLDVLGIPFTKTVAIA